MMNIDHPGMQVPTGPADGPNSKSDRDLLNAYIYDYLLKHNLRESARIFNKEANIASFNRSPPSRNSTPLDDKVLTGDQSPGKKKEDLNGRYTNFVIIYCTLLCSTVMFCAVLCCIALYCTVLCYTVLYCTIFYSSVLSNKIKISLDQVSPLTLLRDFCTNGGSCFGTCIRPEAPKVGVRRQLSSMSRGRCDYDKSKPPEQLRCSRTQCRPCRRAL